ncbi:hypothetical protein EHQ61_11825 [Leptospira wolffii]|uniref:Bor/Iss family lipoprotein n=1 Tax=Leptospira wolffii TaxID=409998 RepID=UPI001082CEEB|nr:hypothetical protein [Leptospira wolffii]TGL49150.1 hypothetical protein EHQ61_11825 [Leptospira wolffii]
MRVGKSISSIGILLSVLLLQTSCRHAMVRYPQALPDACKAYPNSKECKRALDIQASNQGEKGETYKIPHTYYFFGLYPGNIVVDAGRYCPSGPKSVHQYTSFWDGLWEQLTLAIYSPQTVEIECYR